jgi:glycosyltransferase involved in cell wall biosynthesis
MRVMIFDYSGHPFQVQLSRELARQGLDVLHIFSSSFQSPKGNLERADGDPAGFQVRALSNSKPFQKQSFLRRRFQEVEFGRKLAREIINWRPDVVVSSNAPLDVQRLAERAAKTVSATFIFWLQDIYSHAIQKVLAERMPLIGSIVGMYYERLEFRLLRKSDGVVAITSDFAPILISKGVAKDRITVIENWAPLDDIEIQSRDNTWAIKEMPNGVRFVYSGTIGYKHNPYLLLKIAQALPDASVIVFSEGAIADNLAKTAIDENVTNLEIRPWVPFAKLSAALSSADVVVALIEPEAGIYSVPSKVLTYLTVGRPILASVPKVNLAARIIERIGAGVVAEPGDDAAFIAGAVALVENRGMRENMGTAGRDYAVATFDIRSIADRFMATIITSQYMKRA